LQDAVNRRLAALDAELAGTEIRDESVRKMLRAVEGQFFLRVWMPCFLLYRAYPPQLLHAAYLGNARALEKLLTLDKRLLQEPRIARLMQRWADEGQDWNLARVARGIESRPKAVKRKKVTYALAGLISAAYGLIGEKPDAPQVGAVFDLLARRAAKDGVRVDEDIPAGETFVTVHGFTDSSEGAGASAR
jgi:hypothetical protein